MIRKNFITSILAALGIAACKKPVEKVLPDKSQIFDQVGKYTPILNEHTSPLDQQLNGMQFEIFVNDNGRACGTLDNLTKASRYFGVILDNSIIQYIPKGSLSHYVDGIKYEKVKII